MKRPTIARVLSAALATPLLTSPLHATIQPTHWYRMGEDPEPAEIQSRMEILNDRLGDSNLTPHLSELTPLASADTPAASQAGVLSTRSAWAHGAGFAMRCPVFDNTTRQFGFEMFVKPTATTGVVPLASNGNPGINGWQIFLKDGVLALRLGATEIVTQTPLPLGAWSHLALVNSQGTTRLYLNATVGSGSTPLISSTAGLSTPTGFFTLGAELPFSSAGSFEGLFDEARCFTVTSASFSTADLLPASPQMTVILPGRPASDGVTRDLGGTLTGSSDPFVTLIATRLLVNRPAPLVISGASFSGPDAADFRLLTPLPQTYPPGANASLLFAFAPSTPGRKSATLTLVTNDPDDSPFPIQLAATGVPAPLLTVLSGGTPLADSEGDQHFPPTAPGSSSTEQKTFTLRNQGYADIHLDPLSFVGSDATSFTVTRPPSSTTIAPGESTTFDVNFTPPTSGPRTASIAIRSDAVNAPLFHIPVSGSATGPQLQLTGPGDTPLTSHSVIAWGNNNFQQIDVPPHLGAVRSVFDAGYYTAAIRVEGSLVLWGSVPGPVADIPAAATGLVSFAAGGTHALALRQDGTVIAWGDNSAHQTEVPAGLQDVIAVFAAGSSSAAVKADGTLVTWGTGDLAKLPAGLSGIRKLAAGASRVLGLKTDGSVQAWATGNSSGPVYVPGGLTGVIAIGCDAKDQSIALKSDGTLVKWRFSASETQLSSLPTTSSPFVSASFGGSFGGNLGAAVRADGTYVLTPGYLPAEVPAPPSTLGFVSAIASGDSYYAAVQDSIHDFGALATGQTGAPQTFTLTNTGTAPLRILRAGVTGDLSASFTLTAPATPFTLASGQSTPLTVVFHPRDPGVFQATLRLSNDDPSQPDFTVRLAGAAFTVTGPLDAWRLQHFATTADDGDSADDADPNHNGIPNLLEYALGGDPVGNTTGASILPACNSVRRSGKIYSRFTFHRIPAHTDVDLSVESADSPAGPWTEIARSTGGSDFFPYGATTQVSEIPDSGSMLVILNDNQPDSPTARRFFRLQATRPE